MGKPVPSLAADPPLGGRGHSHDARVAATRLILNTKVSGVVCVGAEVLVGGVAVLRKKATQRQKAEAELRSQQKKLPKESGKDAAKRRKKG